MVLAMVRHEVSDYGKWMKHFENDRKNREVGGLMGKETVFRATDNPNDVIIAMEWKNIDSFEKMINSDELKHTIKEAGVISEPSVMFYEGNQKNASCHCHVMQMKN